MQNNSRSNGGLKRKKVTEHVFREQNRGDQRSEERLANKAWGVSEHQVNL